MDFSLSQEQRELKKAVTEFAQRELNQDLVARDRNEEFSHEAWKKCADFGIQGLPIPQEYGGSGLDILSTMCAMEGLGYGCRDSGLIFSLNAQMWSCELPILTFGTEEQKRRFLPGLCSGELIAAHAMTEPGSGSDAYSLQTRVEKKESYILNGTKTFVTNAPLADLMLVYATPDPSRGMRGITAFIAEKGSSEFSVSPMQKMGLRTSPIGDVVFQNCAIPVENLLGREGGGVTVFNSSMEWERSCLLASHLGAMERQLEVGIRYAKLRQQFGKPIGKFQSIANKIVDMKVRIEASRLLLYRVGWLKHMGRHAVMEAALAKLFMSECWIQSSLDAIQIHGGYGYMTETELERELRDAIPGTIYSGTSEIQRVIIAEWLGL